ncbi:MAG: hypothetical protein V1738_02450 [Patescibacteria group bacterium]
MEDPQLDEILPPDGLSQSKPSSQPMPPLQPTFAPNTPPPQLESGPVLEASEYARERQAKKRRSPFVPTVILFLFLAAAGGAVYAAYRGYINLPFLFAKPSLADVMHNLSSAETARLTAKINFAMAERRPEAVEIRLPGDDVSDAEQLALQTSPLAQFFATDMSGEMNLILDRSFSDSASPSALSVNGQFVTAGIETELNGQEIVIGDDIFLRADAIPAVASVYLEPIKNNWVKFSVGENEQATTPPTVFRPKDNLTSAGDITLADRFSVKTDLPAEIALLFSRSFVAGAVTAAPPTTVTDTLGRTIWQYQLTVNSAELIELQNQLVDQRGQLLSNVEAFYLFDKKWTGDDSMSRIISSVRADLQVDSVTEMPTALTMSVSLALQPGVLTGLDDRQLNIKSELMFSNINQPVPVSAPEKFNSWDEALLASTGRSAEDQLMRDQAELIWDIRDALDRYREVHQSYPATLADLIGLEVPLPFSFGDDPKQNLLVVVSVPDDLYTDQPFGYSLSADGDYRLVYEMQVPKFSSFVDRYQFAQGTNTATSNRLSLEGLDHPAIDSNANRPEATGLFADEIRVSIIQAAQKYLAEYYIDHSAYPIGADLVLGSTDVVALCDNGWSNRESCNGKVYVGTVAAAPLPPAKNCSSTDNHFCYSSNGSTYALTFCTGEQFSGVAGGFHIADEHGIDSRPLGDFDVDFDGLSYNQEVALGTDPRNPDTDGDSYSDGQEASGGYNPLGQ